MAPGDDKRYWFPAKKYGYGWGWPTTWEGWVVFIAYFVALAVSGVVWLPRNDITSFTVATAVATVVLVALCVWKGAPARWRGKDSYYD